MKYAGADWLKGNWKYVKPDAGDPSPLALKVADILGAAFLGIYHLDERRLCKVDWTNAHHIELLVERELATFDGSELTALVMAAHDACVRLAISPCSPRYLRLIFHTRTSRNGSIFDRHPTLEENVKVWREQVADLRPESERQVVPLVREVEEAR